MGLFGPKSPEEERLKELTGGFLVSDEYVVILEGNGLTMTEGETIREKIKKEIKNGSLKTDDILDRLDYLIKKKAKSKGNEPKGYDTSILHPNLSKPIKHARDLSHTSTDDLKKMIPNFCPNCGGETDLVTVFCPHCQAYIWNELSDEYIRRLIDDLLNTGEKLDNNDYKRLNLVNELKSNGFSIHSIFLSDISVFLSFLSKGDGTISEEEVKFINEYLHLNFTIKQLNKLAETIDWNYEKKLPISFMIANELDTELKNNTAYLDNMGYFYLAMGMLLIACDGHVDPKEKSVLINYCENLDENIEKLKTAIFMPIDITRKQQKSFKLIEKRKNDVKNRKPDVCKKCGFKNRPNAKFCTKCGNKLI